jgi:hypothetical protein
MMSFRTAVRVMALALSGTAGMAASGTALYQLAERTGWPWITPVLLPIALDMLAVVGMMDWLNDKAKPEARRTGRFNTWAAVGASAAGNAMSHVIVAPPSIGPFSGLSSLVLVVLVGAVPALSLAGIVHQAVLSGTNPVPKRRTVRSVVAQPTSTAVPTGTPEPVLAVPNDLTVTVPTPLTAVPDAGTTAEPDDREAAVREYVRQYHAENGRYPTRDMVRERFRLNARRAGILLLAAKEGEAA